MATIYFTHDDFKNPHLTTGGFFKSGVTLFKATKEIKALNKNLTIDEISINKQYDFVSKDYTQEEFNKLIIE